MLEVDRKRGARHPRRVTHVLALSVAVAGCATSALDTLRWDAARECQQQFARIRSIERIDHRGSLHYVYESPIDNVAFEACYRGRFREKLQATGLAPAGRVAADAETAAKTFVPVTMLQGMTFVAVVVDDRHSATLLLDTGSSRTILSPAFAKRVGVSVTSSSSTQTVHVLGGTTITMPVVRVKSLSVGSLSVENVEVGIYDALPHLTGAEGLLGADFLRRFTVSVDHGSSQLILEAKQSADIPLRRDPQPATGSVLPPQWKVKPLTFKATGDGAIGVVFEDAGYRYVVAYASAGTPESAHRDCEAFKARARARGHQSVAELPCRTLAIVPSEAAEADLWVGYGRAPLSAVVVGGSTAVACRSFLDRVEDVSWRDVACVPVRLRVP